MSDLIKVPMKNFYEDIFTHSFPHHSFIHFFFFSFQCQALKKCQRKDNESGTFLPSENLQSSEGNGYAELLPRSDGLCKDRISKGLYKPEEMHLELCHCQSGPGARGQSWSLPGLPMEQLQSCSYTVIAQPESKVKPGNPVLWLTGVKASTKKM